MSVTTEALRTHLRHFDFGRLFIEELGWNYHKAKPLSIPIDGDTYTLHVVAEKHGFVVYACDPTGSGKIPPYPTRHKIERRTAKYTFEHIIIFTDAARTTQVWQWVRRQLGRPPACRERTFRADQTGESLLQKLAGIAFDLAEEERLSVAVVTGKVQKAFDVEKVTKKFYDRFKTEHDAFLSFIKGIPATADREWYASLMLNRMMFVYFIQKRGFLDGDRHYLRNRLRLTQANGCQDRFLSFYRLFLLRLFHEGLGQPQASRTPELAALLGKVPYLNGGLFDVHELERDHASLEIPDAAFERVFDFFDAYDWHLDERPQRADNEINPDVLGYIFEKYINQKQMGAYYTKEDITGYISRNTLIPFLFDSARKLCPIAFASDGGVWRLLRADPDRYIYAPLRRGVDVALPDDIAAGLKDVSRRSAWNRPASDAHALPTETWREHIARRARCERLRHALATGELSTIGDMVTDNLDTLTFVEDVIVNAEGPDLVWAFWRALQEVSVLDPTCGSGAFLFAALNVLEPLYEACLDGMQGFLDDLEPSDCNRPPETLSQFRTVLSRVAAHPNRRYFVLKSIVIDNLYGVDVMEEAVEICKLRLFLKLVAQVETEAQIEPLPDIDFNIRAGNTLVGFTSLEAIKHAMTMTADGKYRMVYGEDVATLARIEQDAAAADSAFQRFRDLQISNGVDAPALAAAKADARAKLEQLRAGLDAYLASEYGVDPNNAKAFRRWHDTHQPFHWLVEYYGILERGGFDVIIGNPPYVEYKDVRDTYTLLGFKSLACGDLYACVLERSLGLLRDGSSLGMIVPISLYGTDGFLPIQTLCRSILSQQWVSFFANRPAQLFDGAQKRLTILIGQKVPDSLPVVCTTGYLRWRREERESLFPARLGHQRRRSSFEVFPTSLEKLGTSVEVSAFAKLLGDHALGRSIRDVPPGETLFYTRKFGYFLAFLDFVPRVTEVSTGKKVQPSELKSLLFSSQGELLAAIAALTSSTFFWFWNVLSDCRNVNRRDLLAFPLDWKDASDGTRRLLAQGGRKYLKALRSTSRFMIKSGLRIETFDYASCKPIIDEIDAALAKHYAFSDGEHDFIVNYDSKYRLGAAGVDDDGDSE